MKTVVKILNIIRLAFFPMGYALVGALMGSTLNRVMIVELGYGVFWAGVFFAMPELVSPVRVWLGYRSDGFLIMGKRREPYMILGALVIGLGAISVVAMAINGDPSGMGTIIGLILLFAVYGFGRQLGHNSFQALLADKWEGAARSRAATLYEVATMFGLIVGVGIIGSQLRDFSTDKMLSISVVLAAVIFIFSILASLGNEPKVEDMESTADKAREMPFSQVMSEFVFKDPQVRGFFFIVILTFIGTLAQDIFLEPYGGLVLGMNVEATTRLTMYWGLGVLGAMLLSGIFLLQIVGNMNIMRTGMITSMVSFVGLIIMGVLGQEGLFIPMVVIMGIGTGLAGAGMLANIVNFTTKVRAGVLMGVWGFANMMGKALGNLIGGTVIATMLKLTGDNALVSYSSIFVVEIIVLLIALYLTFKVKVDKSKAFAEAAS